MSSMRTLGSADEHMAVVHDIEDPVTRESAEAFVASIETAVSGVLAHVSRASQDPDAMALLIRELSLLRS